MKQELLYDGDCPMCAGAAKWLASRTAVELTPLQDFSDFSPKFKVTSTTPTQAQKPTQAPTPPQIPTQAELLERIHLVDENGDFIAGAKAIAVSLTTSHKLRWRFFGHTMQLPVISSVADWVYQSVARNRRRTGAQVVN